MKLKAGSLKKINKIDKPLAKLIRKKRLRTQIQLEMKEEKLQPIAQKCKVS